MKDVLYTRTNWSKQGEEFLQQIVSIFQDRSLPQIVSGIYNSNAILNLIDRERNDVALYDQRDSKGQMSFTSCKMLNILDNIFVLIHAQSHALSAIQQLQLYAIVFQNVLASN